jgi:hemoglobin-like flavoprotein
LYPCQGFVEPDTIFLVQSSFVLIAQRADEFGKRFYANLFEAYPEIRPLFSDDMAAQINSA